MRHSFFIVLTILAASCTKSKTTTSTNHYFITGIYTTWEKGIFCVTWDTVRIVKAPSQRNTYLIIRHSQFQRNLNEIFFPIEKATTNWSGIYNESSRLLNGLKNYPDIEFYPEQNALRISQAVYTRIE